jgi:putative transcriptional regulator
MSQGELAERIGIARASVNRIERGIASPNVAVALSIAHELGESVETLFGGEL